MDKTGVSLGFDCRRRERPQGYGDSALRYRSDYSDRKRKGARGNGTAAATWARPKQHALARFTYCEENGRRATQTTPCATGRTTATENVKAPAGTAPRPLHGRGEKQLTRGQGISRRCLLLCRRG